MFAWCRGCGLACATPRPRAFTLVELLVANVKDITPEFVRKVVERYKSRVKNHEVCNEPNFTGSIEEYYNAHAMAYKLIREIDPGALVMGPAVMNPNLPWLTRL